MRQWSFVVGRWPWRVSLCVLDGISAVKSLKDSANQEILTAKFAELAPKIAEKSQKNLQQFQPLNGGRYLARAPHEALAISCGKSWLYSHLHLIQ